VTLQKYIELKTSDSGTTLNKKFRVIAPYDDGTPDVPRTIQYKLGGGVDVAYGYASKSWAPTIKVRHTEPDTGYGTMADLETFFGYTNPNGTPSNIITFTDHHGTTETVVFDQTFGKQIMTTVIEGNQAWFTYQVRLIRK
jgi:hypothetical protein